MGTPYPYAGEGVGWGHPDVRSWRMRERLIPVAGMLVPLVIALAISVAMPRPSIANLVVVLAVTIGVACVVGLVLSSHYALTLTLLVLYLGLLDGPIKLESASRAGSAVRDVLIGAIVLGMLMRLGRNRERVKMPPLSGWVLAFAVVVLIEALNPYTGGLLKSLGGYRQQLEWVPFFFFGYMVMRSKQRFRQLFLLLGVIALANGVVGAYQAKIGPSGLAGWGPGYKGVVYGEGPSTGLTGRTFVSEGIQHVRPPALGSDAGFGGGIGVVALPGLLALLAAGRLRRRWPVLLCCAGALLGIATSASRTSTAVGVIVLGVFALLSLAAGLRVSRPLAVIVVIGIITAGVGWALVSTEGKGVLARQETLTSLSRTEETGGEGKQRTLSEIPSDLVHEPFGYGLGIAGSASGFGGRHKPTFEGQRVTGGSAYSLLMKELGFPGLFLWLGLSVSVISLALRRLRRLVDLELRTYIVGLVTGFIALSIQGLSAPTLAVTVGAFLWFVPGVVAYWLAGPGFTDVASSPVGRGGGRSAPRIVSSGPGAMASGLEGAT